jgi:hypothetical protein
MDQNIPVDAEFISCLIPAKLCRFLRLLITRPAGLGAILCLIRITSES